MFKILVNNEVNYPNSTAQLVIAGFLPSAVGPPFQPLHSTNHHVTPQGDSIPMSDYTTIVARVAQMMAILLYLNHVIEPWHEFFVEGKHMT